MRVYVAGRTSELERVNRVQQALRDEGHTISFDWTENPASGIRHDWSDDVPAAEERSIAEMRAIVEDSDALVLLWKDGACGALFETGMAMAFGDRMQVVVSEPTRESVFFYLPWVTRVPRDELIPAALSEELVA